MTIASDFLYNSQPLHIPNIYVSQQLGHSNPGITMKIYAKWIPNEGQRQAMNKLPYAGKGMSLHHDNLQNGSDLEEERRF